MILASRRFLFEKNKRSISWTVPQKSFIKEQVQIAYCRSSGPGGQNVNKRSTKAEVRFKIAEATWIPEEIKVHLIEMAANKQNNEGEFFIANDHARTQELNLSNCLNQIRQLLEDAYRLANGGVTKGQSKVDKIKRNNDRNRRRRAKKEALISSTLESTKNISTASINHPSSTTSASKTQITSPRISSEKAGKTAPSKTTTIKSPTKTPTATASKTPLRISTPTEDAQFMPFRHTKQRKPHDTTE
jgi:peptidyl-tRNA hydrolase ICT1